MAIGTYIIAKSSASTNYAAVCGDGYKLKAKFPYEQSFGFQSIYVKDSGDKTDWCSLTIRDGSAKGVSGNTLTWMLWMDGKTPAQKWGEQVKDEGKFKFYAGPIYIKDKKYVKVGGYIQYNNTKYGFENSKGGAKELSN